jgi:hypothetical protein
MKTLVFRHLNDIVSLTVLTLMAMALIAGQVEAAAQAVDVARQDSNLNLQVVIEVRSQ